jgi:O-antigen/teichoic acid export membrane protein
MTTVDKALAGRQRHALRRLTGPALVTASRMAGAGLGFGAQVLLAHLMAPDALGTFFAATSIVPIVGVIVTLGHPATAIRFIARYRETGRPAQLAAFLRLQERTTWWLAVVATALILTLALGWPDVPLDTRGAYAAAALAIPAFAAFALYPTLAAAGRRYALWIVPEVLVRPAGFLVCIGCLALLNLHLSATLVTAAFLMITSVIALVQARRCRRVIATQGVEPRASAALVRMWRAEGLPLIAVTILTTMFADFGILVASIVLDGGDLAGFGLALKLAMLVGFSVQASHQRRDQSRREAAVRRATVFPLLATLAALLVVAVAGPRILALFGPGFPAYADALTLLVLSQALRAAFGPGVTMLSLLGRQKANAAACVATALALAVSMPLLAAVAGPTGAAAAVVLAFAVWGGVSSALLWRSARIRCDAAATLLPGIRRPG